MPLVVRTTGVEEYLDAAGHAHIKALILGEPSAGKTRSASFWPSPIFADCEKGRMSLADRNVPYVEITASQDMDALLTMLERECAKPPAERKYQTLVIDTVDAFQRIIIHEILRAQKKDAMSGWQDWGALDAKMQSLINRLHKLSMNIVVNSHIKPTKDGDDGPLINQPKLKGDLREQISAEFDLVGHMATFWEAEGGERVLKRAIKWHPEPNFPVLKDRTGQLPKFTDVTFTETDYTRLFELMFGGEHFESLEKSQQVDELDVPSDTVEAPRDGGPVAVKAAPARQEPEAKPEPRARKAAAKAPAKKVAAAKPTPATSTTVFQPADPSNSSTAPVAKAAAKPEPAEFQPPTMEQAQQTVEEILGGRVISEEHSAEAIPMPAETPPASAPASMVCGQPATSLPAVDGCGKSLVGVADQDMINIAVIRTKTFLCPDCFKAWKTAKK